MSKFRLKETHPDMIAFNKACKVLEEMGISLNIPYGQISTEITIKRNKYVILDSDSDSSITEFPPFYECKLIFEK